MWEGEGFLQPNFKTSEVSRKACEFNLWLYKQLNFVKFAWEWQKVCIFCLSEGRKLGAWGGRGNLLSKGFFEGCL